MSCTRSKVHRYDKGFVFQIEEGGEEENFNLLVDAERGQPQMQGQVPDAIKSKEFSLPLDVQSRWNISEAMLIKAAKKLLCRLYITGMSDPDSVKDEASGSAD